MKRLVNFILLLFITFGLFAEWKETKIPKTAVHTIEAFENENCRVAYRRFIFIKSSIFDEYEYADIVVVFDDGWYYLFEYSDELLQLIKENGDLDYIATSKIAADYDACLYYDEGYKRISDSNLGD